MTAADQTLFDQIKTFIETISAGAATLWAITTYILQPAYKIAQSEERARQYQATSEAYKTRIDEMMEHMETLRRDIREQTRRADMLLFYIAERLAWERGDQKSMPPILPSEFENTLYELLRTKKRASAQGVNGGPQGDSISPSST